MAVYRNGKPYIGACWYCDGPFKTGMAAVKDDTRFDRVRLTPPPYMKPDTKIYAHAECQRTASKK